MFVINWMKFMKGQVIKMFKKVVMMVSVFAVLAGFASIASASTPIMGKTTYVSSTPIMRPVSIANFSSFYFLGF